MSAPLYRLKDVRYSYPGSSAPALDGISVDIEEGEFVLVCGASGSGKSTLARLLGGLLPHHHGGHLEGTTLHQGGSILDRSLEEFRRSVGIVFEHPERQIITHMVEHEIVFGLENLDTPSEEMRRTLAEVCALLDCRSLLPRNPHELSGGEQQRVALAAAVAMARDCLVLDEPASQLDPSHAEMLFQSLRKLHEDHGLAIIVTEQRTDLAFPLADRVLLLEEGRIALDESPRAFAKRAASFSKRAAFLPPVTRLFANEATPPLTLKEGRALLADRAFNLPASTDRSAPPETPALELEGWKTGYENRPVLDELDLSLARGEILAVLGENGAGKSTLLKTILGFSPVATGRIRAFGRDLENAPRQERLRPFGYLSQNADDHLVQETVEEEMRFTVERRAPSDPPDFENLLSQLGLDGQQTKNPRDLSAGNRQLVALASVLVARPNILLVDEPTRGLDPFARDRLATLFRDLAANGTSVLLVTQDVDFAAEIAHRVALLFQGRWAALDSTREVLGQGLYYASSMARLFRGHTPGVVTESESHLLVAS